MSVSVLFESHLDSLDLINRGKVRDIYAIDDEHLLFVASDRLSAFDVVLPDPVPHKGRVLTALSSFWFEHLAHIIGNHTTTMSLLTVIRDEKEYRPLMGRTMVVKRVTPLPVEAVVRGYLIGSGWREYQAKGEVCGHQLPRGLQQADKLPEVIFTPSTKAQFGGHDMNIDFDDMVNLVGSERAERVRDVSLKLYTEAAKYAATKGIIIADSKFEFGVDNTDNLILIDEVLTPDSSRFWPAESYQSGVSPVSFDKQFVRDYLDDMTWNKEPPAPRLPKDIVQNTSEKYLEAERRLLS